ncbi:MAG: hypothetical protein LBV57_04610 [Candidatus Symbiothrix sp.]|jgi:hypothetical protein|nr:hypothetical protein [Candidatus Symbiothrix sp.]
MKEMEKIAFDMIVVLKVQSVIPLLMERKHLSFKQALQYLYASELYQMLENEATKVWHYSPMMLCTLVEKEKTSGQLILPDHV